MKKFIIKASKQITLPVTPESFEAFMGRRIETVNIHEVGDVNLPGGLSLGTIKVSCMFPKHDYPFALDYGDPYEYVEKIQKIIKKKNPVRFVVSDTDVNERVLIEEISYGEKDGTGDVYATITMRGYRKVSAAQTAAVEAVTPTATTAVLGASANRARDTGEASAPVQTRQTYRGKKYQSYAEIARDIYKVSGNELYSVGLALSRYNNSEANTVPAILFGDQTLACPTLEVLKGVAGNDQRKHI